MDTIVTIATAAGTSAAVTIGWIFARYRFQVRAERAMLRRWSRTESTAYLRAAKGR